MSRGGFSVASGLVMLGLASAGLSAQANRCTDDRMVDRCDPAQHARVLSLFGLPQIETYVDSGAQVRRAFFVDGYGNDVAAVAFLRVPGREPVVSVHFPSYAGAVPAMSAAVPEEIWRDVIERSAFFHRQLIPVPAINPNGACMHGWNFTVESIDPKGLDLLTPLIRRKTENACGDGLAGAYAFELAAAARSLFSYCRGLGIRHERNDVTQLAACGTFRGDRNAAAAALSSIDEFSRALDLREVENLRRLLFGADIEWQEERRNEGDVAKFVLGRYAKGDGGHLVVHRLEGISPFEVRVIGVLSKFLPQDRPATGAPWPRAEAQVKMLWRGRGITSLSVGKFELVRNADPTLPVGRR